MDKTPDVTLFAVSISDVQDMEMELSPEIKAIVPEVAQMVLSEAASTH